MGSGKREHGRLVPKDLRSRDRRHRHHLDLDFGAGLVGIDLQEHITDTKRRPLAMGDDNLDLLHVAIIAGMNRDVIRLSPDCVACVGGYKCCVRGRTDAEARCADSWSHSDTPSNDRDTS